MLRTICLKLQLEHSRRLHLSFSFIGKTCARPILDVNSAAENCHRAKPKCTHEETD